MRTRIPIWMHIRTFPHIHVHIRFILSSNIYDNIIAALAYTISVCLRCKSFCPVISCIYMYPTWRQLITKPNDWVKWCYHHTLFACVEIIILGLLLITRANASHFCSSSIWFALWEHHSICKNTYIFFSHSESASSNDYYYPNVFILFFRFVSIFWITYSCVCIVVSSDYRQLINLPVMNHSAFGHVAAQSGAYRCLLIWQDSLAFWLFQSTWKWIDFKKNVAKTMKISTSFIAIERSEKEKKKNQEEIVYFAMHTHTRI